MTRYDNYEYAMLQVYSWGMRAEGGVRFCIEDLEDFLIDFPANDNTTSLAIMADSAKEELLKAQECISKAIGFISKIRQNINLME